MGEFVFKDGAFRMGTSGALTTTLSPYVTSIQVNYSAEIHDITPMGDNSRNRLAGLKDWSMTVGFNQDFASSDMDMNIFNKIGAESSNCFVTARARSTSPTASNPEFRGRALLDGYTPIREFTIVFRRWAKAAFTILLNLSSSIPRLG